MNLTRSQKVFIIFALSFLVFISYAAQTTAFAADIGNCLLCHKYPGLSRIDEEGHMRLFFINEAISLTTSGPASRNIQ